MLSCLICQSKKWRCSPLRAMCTLHSAHCDACDARNKLTVAVHWETPVLSAPYTVLPYALGKEFTPKASEILCIEPVYPKSYSVYTVDSMECTILLTIETSYTNLSTRSVSQGNDNPVALKIGSIWISRLRRNASINPDSWYRCFLDEGLGSTCIRCRLR